MKASSGNNGNKRRKRRGAASDPEIQMAVAFQVQGGRVSAPEVRTALVQQFGDANVPSVRTIRDMVNEVMKQDPWEAWTIADADPDDIAIVAPVWAVGLELGFQLSKKHADWIVRVRKAVPDLPLADAWGLAGFYAMSRDGLLDWGDALIAFAPWRSADHGERYFSAGNAGRIPIPPVARNLALRWIRPLEFDRARYPQTTAWFDGHQKEVGERAERYPFTIWDFSTLFHDDLDA